MKRTNSSNNNLKDIFEIDETIRGLMWIREKTLREIGKQQQRDIFSVIQTAKRFMDKLGEAKIKTATFCYNSRFFKMKAIQTRIYRLLRIQSRSYI